MSMSKDEIAAQVQAKMAVWRAKQAQGAKLLMSSNVSNDSNNFAPVGDVRVLPELPVNTNSVAPSPTQDDDATNTRVLITHLGERDTGSEGDAARESISVAQRIGQEEVYHLRADFFDNGEECDGSRYKVNIHYNLDHADDFTTLTIAFASRERDFLHNLKGSEHWEFYQGIDKMARGMAREEGFDWDIRPAAGKLRKQQKKYGPKEKRGVIPAAQPFSHVVRANCLCSCCGLRTFTW